MKRLSINPGDRFNNWVVIQEVEPDKHGHRRFICRCMVCQGEKNLDICAFKYGGSKKCRSCATRSANVTHGRSRSPEHQTWLTMKRRCYKPGFVGYENYGGRGIRICERWLEDFANFYADMGPRPSPKHSIERIDVDGDYCPENCRWATKQEQARNTRANRWLEFDGKRMLLSDWARHLNMPITTLCNRLNTYGWSVERALTTPVKKSRSQVQAP